jgi:hypothetical protein
LSANAIAIVSANVTAIFAMRQRCWKQPVASWHFGAGCCARGRRFGVRVVVADFGDAGVGPTAVNVELLGGGFGQWVL